MVYLTALRSEQAAATTNRKSTRSSAETTGADSAKTTRARSAKTTPMGSMTVMLGSSECASHHCDDHQK